MRCIEKLEADLADLDAALLHRRRRVVESAAQPHLRAEGKELLSFCSNDYLGLANHPAIIEALTAGARRWGAGSGASHLVGGHLQPHEELERQLADFLGFEATPAVTGIIALCLVPRRFQAEASA